MVDTYVFGVSTADAPPAISNNTTDADHDIDIASKFVVSDDYVALSSPGALTKQLDAAWAVGTDAGGLDTGSVATDTWYSVWAIAKADKVQDVLFSTSASSPTMPASYIYKRRIGWIKTDGSGNIIPFRQEGDKFYWLSYFYDYSSIPSGGGTTVTVSCPPSTIGNFVLEVRETGSHVPQIAITPTWSTADWPIATGVKGHGGTAVSAEAVSEVPVDSSSQVNLKSVATGANGFDLRTIGWLDRRGRDD